MRFVNEQELVALVRQTAGRVPAYGAVLAEAGVDPGSIHGMDDFARLPLLDKHNTFARFGIEQLCLDGRLGRLGAVLTSSGHSGVFAFGLYRADEMAGAARALDDMFDAIFGVRSHSTLLINCLPMGVRVYSEVCTLGEVSVREDMAVGLVRKFGPHFDQILLVGEVAFIKRVLEYGSARGVDWKQMRVHVAVGEEVMAENARIHVERLVGIDPADPSTGKMITSMGIGEIGLDLFHEEPTGGLLPRLRRAIHEFSGLRAALVGPEATIAPLVFTYDPGRIHVEFTAEGRLVITTLGLDRPIPLIRYVPGDAGQFLCPGAEHRDLLAGHGIDPARLGSMPIVLIHGRGRSAAAGDGQIWPEQVKEGLYADGELAALMTGNFRIVPGDSSAIIRIQLSPDAEPAGDLDARFAEAIERYTAAPFRVRCEPYASFASGMVLDYERKFDYLGP